MSARRRVVVTGMGAACAAGRGVEAFWDACIGGRSALTTVTAPAAARLDQVLAGVFPQPLPAGRERAAALAAIASAEAIAQAAPRPGARRTGATGTGAPDAGTLPPGTGIAIGTCLGGALDMFAWIETASGPGAAGPPGPPPSGHFASPARSVAAEHALDGPVIAISSACTSGLAAIAQAAEAIRMGEADCMLAGGADALSEFVIAGFGLLGALTATRVRPFDRRRDGLAIGEGAGILVLEEATSAAARGARALAEIAGCGTAADAHHMRGPSPEGDGLSRAIAAALEDTGCPAGDVELIGAHGTGTVQNDRMEARAIRHRFGDAALRIPVTSTKAITGHTLGAAGALAAIVCIRAMAVGVIPPTCGCDDPDEELDLVRDLPRRGAVRRALAMASGFAGHNAAILLAAP